MVYCVWEQSIHVKSLMTSMVYYVWEQSFHAKNLMTSMVYLVWEQSIGSLMTVPKNAVFIFGNRASMPTPNDIHGQSTHAKNLLTSMRASMPKTYWHPWSTVFENRAQNLMTSMVYWFWEQSKKPNDVHGLLCLRTDHPSQKPNDIHGRGSHQGRVEWWS